MKTTPLRKTTRKYVEPSEFERLSLGGDLGRRWCPVLPTSVRLSVDALAAYNQTLDPQEIKRVCHDLLQVVCETHGMQAAISIPSPHSRHASGFVLYTDRIWDHALEALSDHRAKLDPQCKLALPTKEADQSAQHVLLELEAIRNEKDEPDFRHSSTDHANSLAKQIIEGAYTHYIGSAPEPAAAPDGDGGLVIDWQVGRRLVSLVVPADEDESAYVYSKSGDDPSEMDDPATDEALARRLRSVFAD